MSRSVQLTEEARILEAILFMENDAVTIEKLVHITEYTELTISDAMQDLMAFYQSGNHGVELVQQGSEYQFLPSKDLWPQLKERYGKKIDKRLTRASLETLSIIAYSQPVTRKDVEAIRGVSSDTILRLLKEKELIRVVGYSDGPGRPSLYGTTTKFLKNFNLSSIASLPRLNDIDEERFQHEE